MAACCILSTHSSSSDTHVVAASSCSAVPSQVLVPCHASLTRVLLSDLPRRKGKAVWKRARVHYCGSDGLLMVDVKTARSRPGRRRVEGCSNEGKTRSGRGRARPGRQQAAGNGPAVDAAPTDQMQMRIRIRGCKEYMDVSSTALTLLSEPRGSIATLSTSNAPGLRGTSFDKTTTRSAGQRGTCSRLRIQFRIVEECTSNGILSVANDASPRRPQLSPISSESMRESPHWNTAFPHSVKGPTILI